MINMINTIKWINSSASRFLSLFFLSLALLWTVQLHAEKKQYNILLFTADDLHGESLATYGSKIDMTPNLDAFAKTGMVFDKYHVNVAICAPCRAVIATGRYSHNSGAMGFMPAREDIPTVVSLLKAQGYMAGILGKVAHSSPNKTMTWDYRFDQKELGNGRSPTIYYQRSKTFLEKCKTEGKPFYFMVNSHDPHRKYCYPDKLLPGAEMPSKVYRPEEVEVPGFVPDLPGVREELAAYQNSTRRLDDTFGKVLEALKETGFEDNTIVLFQTDNGIAIPFAKCNTWFHASKSPMLVRLPGVIKPGRDDKHFVSTIDLLPTFLELAGVKKADFPDKLGGRSFLSLLHGETQSGREKVYTQIDSKAGGDAVPMRCIQDEQFGYIYNPFSDGKHWYRNNNEGQTMAAMNVAAKTDPAIAARIQLFRYRVPEEFYDLKKDPNCLNNLIDNPEYQSRIVQMRKQLMDWMRENNDPMLAAFENKDNRQIVDEVLLKTYGPPKAKKKKGEKGGKKKNRKKKQDA